jgi:acylpyruvate hydrolase
MRLVTVRTAAGTRAGRVEGDEIVLLDAGDVGALLADTGAWRERAGGGTDRIDLATADLAPVVPRPPKVICLGLNYLRHVVEMGREAPAHPTLFAKYARALIGHGDPIVLPVVSDQVDWEVELGVVIGTPGRHIPAERALDHVAGYTVVNDISVRDWQRRTTQFLQGKTFEGTTPVGPALVTPDELPPGAVGLEVRCEVNGEVMQRDRTDELLFGVAATIAYVSRIITLEPGDLIATGTPEGVGAGRTPPVFLREGDVVRTVVEGVGELVNTCVRERPPVD